MKRVVVSCLLDPKLVVLDPKLVVLDPKLVVLDPKLVVFCLDLFILNLFWDSVNG